MKMKRLMCIIASLVAAAAAEAARSPFAGARWIGQDPVPAYCPAATNQQYVAFRKRQKSI